MSPSGSPVTVAVLASGGGSNLAAILEAGIPVAVVLVDRPCGAVEVASTAGVPVEMVPRSSFGPDFDRATYTENVVAALRRYGVGLVAMAGFGTVLGKPMYEAFPERVLNTHPALLPDFKGWHAVRDALAAKVKVTGCTIHIATVEVDEGPILAQEVVPIERHDTEETLHERIKTVERRLYPATIQTYLAYMQWLEAQWRSAGAEVGSDLAGGGFSKPRWVGSLRIEESTADPPSRRDVPGAHDAPGAFTESDPRSRSHPTSGADPVPGSAPMRRALVSVWDKSGVVDLARSLTDLGFEIVSSGGTSAALGEAGVAHTMVEKVTGAPEMLGGRVKTLHPAVHGGILADRTKPEHLDDLAAQDIELIDLVVCNLYPFRSDPGIELIDIGGPTMVRAAAKNHDHVGVVVDPADYPVVVEEFRSAGSLSASTRRRLARKAFAHTAAYDAAIVGWLDSSSPSSPSPEDVAGLPPTLHVTLERAQDLRYGENPHQVGARYRNAELPTWWDSVVQHSGMGLSYLNLFDAEAAWRLVHEVASLDPTRSAAVIVKHANPCGVALGPTLATAYERAFACDTVSAFGGIVALAGTVTTEVATAMAAAAQADVIVAPEYEPDALEILIAKRKNTRILAAGPPRPVALDLRRLDTGYLVQEPDAVNLDTDQWKVVTNSQPTGDQWSDARLAWLVCARTTSNAIVIVSGDQAIGIGAGQQNRLESARIAVSKAGEKVPGSVAASDAFFPFRDTLDALAESGVGMVIQPGGSVRDKEVIAAADEHGIAMVLTGERHFRH